MQKITPFLWFDDKAEEAAEHYVSVFNARPGAADGSGIVEVSRYGEGGPGRPGPPVMVDPESPYVRALRDSAAPHSEGRAKGVVGRDGDSDAVSFLVSCETQEEVDAFWSALSEGGEEGPCGWLKDRYGVSWQIIPTALSELLGDPDPGRSQRALQAMLQMKKIDIAGLQRAAEAA